MPAYKSRIGPAFSANRGSFGKSQCSYCQGLIADSCNIRHTVLRLIFLRSIVWRVAPGRRAIAGSAALPFLRSFRTPSLGSTLDPEGEKAGLRPRPA